MNLLYVALTRAKRLLVINDALFFLLTSSFINNSLEYLLPVQPAYPSRCVKCRGGVEVTGPVSMYQERMRVGDLTKCGGWLCSNVAYVLPVGGGWSVILWVAGTGRRAGGLLLGL